jgi:superfamily II DNA or RNA helicase
VPPLKRGLYESLVTESLDANLEHLALNRTAVRSGLRAAEASDRIALHVGQVIERAVRDIPDKDRASLGISIARKLIDVLVELLPSTSSPITLERPVAKAMVLRSISAHLPDGRPEEIAKPLIPLLDTVLLTNAPGEPNVGSQVKAEVHSADRIDVVMAFIRYSGIRPLIDGLRGHHAAGRQIRVLTTTYTGSTEARALDLLRDLGAEIRVSYDVSGTRLHAKAWLFHRDSGSSTAYIGSSNLTHSAQSAGLEWNVRVSAARNPAVVEKVAAVFESYWNSQDFKIYDPAEFIERTQLPHQIPPLSPTYVRPEPFQERLLEQIALSRTLGHHRNLLVAATGTGKTVMAALDYVRLQQQLPRARLLFIAHREEILKQSLATFRQALRSPGFGELWVRGRRPVIFEHVFASIQSISASGLAHLPPEHFDVVVIDEFHHAAAQSYSALLNHVRPNELLGLTATPERSDGLPILNWFDGRIAAELRLWDAIDQQRLSPFEYYGIHDGLDLRNIPWRRGAGYDAAGLTNVLTANDFHAKVVLKELLEHVGNPNSIRALGFCVSIEHARFMTRVFNENGVTSVAIWADTPEEDRQAALTRLAAGTIKVVFSVDLFNEGVDVPTVDTLLLLRPTDSATLFLQQLGRGLRKSTGKRTCTVLDFVGHHRKEFRFDRRLGALLGGTRKDLEDQICNGFPFLPAGCYMELDRVASEIVLDNIRAAIPSSRRAKAQLLRNLSSDSPKYSLSDFLVASDLDLEDIYGGSLSWSDLCEDAGLPIEQAGPYEIPLRRACGRLLHIDDKIRIDTYLQFLSQKAPPDVATLGGRDQTLLRMLVGSMMKGILNAETAVGEAAAVLWAHRQITSELCQLLAVLSRRLSHLGFGLRDISTPLEVHASYTRIEILAAFHVGAGMRFPPWQSGVFWSNATKSDLLAFTLDKTSGGFSPTTRYRDFAISTELIHWESQSMTRADSPTGLRYQHHVQRGSQIMLFARRRNDDRAFYFLGPATYVSHVSERPMSITWRLQHPLPGDLFADFAAAVA